MIKVGQIYSYEDFTYCVTKTIPRRDIHGFIIKAYQAICNDGFCFDELSEEDIIVDKLIAEYPTWQEAVNSKEFKNE